MALTDVSPFNEVDFISFCIDPGLQAETRPCCGTLFLAPMLDTGTANAEEVYTIATYQQAVELFGEGSIAADMVQYYEFGNRFGELYVAGFEDLGNKASLPIRITGTAENSQSLELQIAGVIYSVPVTFGDTAAEIIADFRDIINADANAVVSATSTSTTLTITAKNGGEQGNDINIYDVTLDAPVGVEMTFDGPSLSGGAGRYDLESILEEYCECCYDFVAVPWSDTATLAQLEKFTQLRHTCDKLIGGRWYTTRFDTFSDHIAANDANSYFYGTIWNECQDEVHTPWAQTAAAVGRGHLRTCADPAEDWRFENLIGIRCNTGLCNVSCFNKDERNLLVMGGGSTTRCVNGTKQLEVTVGAGQYAFDSYFKYPQTDYTTFRFVREFNDFLLETFGQSKLVDSIANVPTGSSAVDIPTILSSIVTWIGDTQAERISNIDDIRQSIQIERDPSNPSRINIGICPSIVTALRKFAIQVRPKLGDVTNSNV